MASNCNFSDNDLEQASACSIPVQQHALHVWFQKLSCHTAYAIEQPAHTGRAVLPRSSSFADVQFTRSSNDTLQYCNVRNSNGTRWRHQHKHKAAAISSRRSAARRLLDNFLLLHPVLLACYLVAGLLMVACVVSLLQHQHDEVDSTTQPVWGARQHQGNRKPHVLSTSINASKLPKVALLFLVQDSIPNEPVWRAFFEAAGNLTLTPVAATTLAAAVTNSAATAATAAAAAGATATLRGVLGNKSLHPALESYKSWEYPTYQIQHGLTPGADPPAEYKLQHSTHYFETQDLQVAAGSSLNSQTGQGSSPSCSGNRSHDGLQDQQFPAATFAWEQDIVHREMQRLLRESASSTGQLWHKQQAQDAQQQHHPGVEHFGQLNAMHQLSTVQDAVATAEAAATAANAAGKPAAKGRQQQQQQRNLHPVLASQQLFTVYVHVTAGVLLPPHSLFSRRELPVRLNTTKGYAQHVLAEAEVLLLKAALEDTEANNVKFVLVSDTSIPLYRPEVIWAQLISESLSRVDACLTNKTTSLHRWRAAMATHHFGPQHWRKSSQWFALTRQHTLLAVADQHIREIFHRHCYTNLTRMFPTCVSDEHYLPSLLASYGLENQTDCQGSTHYADWSAHGWHPKAFGPSCITRQLVQNMRTGLLSSCAAPVPVPAPCSPAPAAQTVPAMCNFTSAVLSAASIFDLELTEDDIDAFDITAQVEFAANGTALNRTNTGRPAATALAVEQVLRFMQSVFQAPPHHAANSTAGQVPNASSELQHSSTSIAEWIVAAGYRPLGSLCPLFARKFPITAVDETVAMALSCAGLGLGHWCKGG
eukprot:GHRR01018162.1.p1 GENE.GHRR01018162.1~~GHRR01018162.1.p1  ORF type:complete len:820 (+),score=269.78 GHRR01018162.1:194-2653(+)